MPLVDRIETITDLENVIANYAKEVSVNHKIAHDSLKKLRFATRQVVGKKGLGVQRQALLVEKIRGRKNFARILAIVLEELKQTKTILQANKYVESLLLINDAHLFATNVMLRSVYVHRYPLHDLSFLPPLAAIPLPPSYKAVKKEHTKADEKYNEIDKHRIRKWVARRLNAEHEKSEYTLREFFSEAGKYSFGMASFTGYNLLSKNTEFMRYTFPVVLGIFPIPHVQEIEVARSGKIIKFRATGSIFLAQQEGGEDAVRIECLLLPEENIWLLYLWILFLWGKSKTKEIDNLMMSGADVSHGKIRSLIADISSSNVNTTKPSYEHHNTFPLVTRHVILTNVYIETLSFEDRIVDGKNVLKVSILLRTYLKPSTFTQYHKDETVYYGPRVDKTIMMYKVLEIMANMLWRYANMNGIMIEESSIFSEQSFKTGLDSSDSDDVYYDIDGIDIAQTLCAGLAGLI